MQDRPFKPSHLYVQVRDEIAKRIADKVYPPESQLPNEFLLAQEMRVSIGTIRKAVEALSDEKLVVRSQGRGTIVSNRTSAEYRSKFDRIRTSDGAVVDWTVREIGREEREATEIEQAKLKLQPRARISQIRRLQEANGRAVKIETATLPRDLCGSLSELDIQDTMIENISIMRNVTITYSDERLKVVGANEEDAQVLGVEFGTPVICLDRVVYDAGRTPVEWQVAHVNLGENAYHVPSPIGGRAIR